MLGTTNPTDFQNIFITPRGNLGPIRQPHATSHLPPAPETTNWLSVSMELHILDITYKSDHTICDHLHLASSTLHNVFEAHPHCSTCHYLISTCVFNSIWPKFFPGTTWKINANVTTQGVLFHIQLPENRSTVQYIVLPKSGRMLLPNTWHPHLLGHSWCYWKKWIAYSLLVIFDFELLLFERIFFHGL